MGFIQQSQQAVAKSSATEATLESDEKPKSQERQE